MPPWARLDLDAARALVDAATSDGSTPLLFSPTATKKGASAARLAVYRPATTLGEYRALHASAPAGPTWRADLVNDLAKGLVAMAPALLPPRVSTARVSTWTAWEQWPVLEGFTRLVTAAQSGCWRAVRSLRAAPVAAVRVPAPTVAPLVPALWPATRAALDAIEVLAARAGDARAPAGVAACLAETVELRRLDSLEQTPLPGAELIGPMTTPPPPSDDVTQTTAYCAGVRVLRVALTEDYAGMPALDPPGPEPASWGAAAPPHLAFMAAPEPLAPVAPASVAAARRDPDFDAEFGWFTAIAKEISRVEGFDAWELASARQVRADRALYGEQRVSIGYIVAVLTCKLDPAGDPREPGILKKFRVAIADAAGAASGVQTHSNCADDVTNRIITAVAKAIKAEMDSIDISGAYFHGIPLSMLLGGRRLYVRIPKWLSDLFPLKYPQKGAHGANFLLIKGNMPGRCDAGRIWQQRFDTFLRGFGLKQLLTDRRVWIKHTPAGRLILHDHVDDTRITASCAAVREEFHAAWAAEFRETIVIRPLSEDFTGLRHTPTGPRTVAISCGGVVRRLETLLIEFPLAKGVKCDWPLALISLEQISAGPSEPSGSPLPSSHAVHHRHYRFHRGPRARRWLLRLLRPCSAPYGESSNPECGGRHHSPRSLPCPHEGSLPSYHHAGPGTSTWRRDLPQPLRLFFGLIPRQRGRRRQHRRLYPRVSRRPRALTWRRRCNRGRGCPRLALRNPARGGRQLSRRGAPHGHPGLQVHSRGTVPPHRARRRSGALAPHALLPRRSGRTGRYNV